MTPGGRVFWQNGDPFAPPSGWLGGEKGAAAKRERLEGEKHWADAGCRPDLNSRTPLREKGKFRGKDWGGGGRMFTANQRDGDPEWAKSKKRGSAARWRGIAARLEPIGLEFCTVRPGGTKTLRKSVREKRKVGGIKRP